MKFRSLSVSLDMASISFLLILLASFSVCPARYHGAVTRGTTQHADYGHVTKVVSRVFGEEESSSGSKVLRIVDFGAKGNGIDDTNAFNNAWKAACSSTGSVVLVVPANNYLLKPVRFVGPCKANPITVRISGTINASTNRSDYNDLRWLSFDAVDSLTVEGGATINGNGDVWWKESCKLKKSSPCITKAPTALSFNKCNNLRVRDLKVKDSMQTQVAFKGCNNVAASDLTVTADGQHSPNTDGIHISHTKFITISDCVIATGDDCISITTGSQAVRANNITCGPGHGISIGSLGGHNSEGHVSDVIVDGAKFSHTTNGLRIKTWQGGSGYVNKVKFMNAVMNNVKFPIIIDQNYCDRRNACPKQSSAVQVSDVLYKNITGTSASEIAINFDCSESFQCEKIVLQDVDIQRYGNGGKNAKASCQNIRLAGIGVVAPSCPNSGAPPPKPKPDPSSGLLSVDDFGAKGNGADDTNAFNNAWKAACSSTRPVVLVVPENNYLVKPVRFVGPCKANPVTVRISGTIEASTNRSDYGDNHWLFFENVNNLIVEGGGTVNGNGDVWWKESCKLKKSSPCITDAPTALTFQVCNNLRVRDLNVKDSPQMQVAFERCQNVIASDLTVTADGHSPNTDGIHITHTNVITISDCLIATGDDCISIGSGSRAVRANNITCGPGHGISIGSLGRQNSKAYVSDVIVNGAKLSHTTNGLRIKTWQGGSGYVNNVKFMNVEMNNVRNPIIIDQNYCFRRNACPKQRSAVQVSDVLYKNITGTSASEIAINFVCSENFQCEKIVLQDVHIQRYGTGTSNPEASCQNVQLTGIGIVAPSCPNSGEKPKSDGIIHDNAPPPPKSNGKIHNNAPPPPKPKTDPSSRVLSIVDFGAKGNGADDTNAFNNAWKAACSSTGSVVLVVPKTNYLVKPVRFEGPCKANQITVQISGTLDASTHRSDYGDKHWLIFVSVNNLTVEGGGTLNGHGDVWWKQSCKIKKSSSCITQAPTALTFHACINLNVRDLKVKDSMQMQVAFENCRNVTASDLTVTADGRRSPNTDGIHITHTKFITISDTVIATGDDCISIVSGSQTVRANNITCGPGHGISIGSLGSQHSEAHVSDVIVDGAKFSHTTNGLRIKTWQGGSGYVNNVKFMNVVMNNVENPIIIDQNYCDRRNACPKQSSAVQVSDVLYRNITGTSASEIAINFDCSESFQCEKIVLQDVHIQRYGSKTRNPEASCQNVQLTGIGVVMPPCPNSGEKPSQTPGTDHASQPRHHNHTPG